MFYFAASFNGDLSKWDVSEAIDMRRMFASVSSFNGDLSKWDVSSVTNMQNMFSHATSFNCDLSRWDVSRVYNMVTMFRSASSFKHTLCGKWKTSTAKKDNVFLGSGGKLCASITTSTTSRGKSTAATTATRANTSVWPPKSRAGLKA